MDPAMAEHLTGQRELAAWSSFSAVLFDLDGVITPTASVHRVAWAELFEAFDFTEETTSEASTANPAMKGSLPSWLPAESRCHLARPKIRPTPTL